MKNDILETKINYEACAEDIEPKDPIQELYDLHYKSISRFKKELDNHYKQLEEKYPDYIDFYYESDYIGHGFGTKSMWFNLIGVKSE